MDDYAMTEKGLLKLCRSYIKQLKSVRFDCNWRKGRLPAKRITLERALRRAEYDCKLSFIRFRSHADEAVRLINLLDQFD